MPPAAAEPDEPDAIDWADVADGAISKAMAFASASADVASVLRRLLPDGAVIKDGLNISVPLPHIKLLDNWTDVKATVLALNVSGLNTLQRHDVATAGNHSLALSVDLNNTRVAVDIEVELVPAEGGHLAGTPDITERLRLEATIVDASIGATVFVAVNRSAITLAHHAVAGRIPSLGCLVPTLLNVSVRQVGRRPPIGIFGLGLGND